MYDYIYFMFCISWSSTEYLGTETRQKETEKGKKSNDFLPYLNIYEDPTECLG